ncbi:hypothetical protein F5141DRAFT_1062724 [Pisolithus sp. B1]|nr:hypothetical protein F5141DRAFT_1062724 [Pisolithus sp. B1]
MHEISQFCGWFGDVTATGIVTRRGDIFQSFFVVVVVGDAEQVRDLEFVKVVQSDYGERSFLFGVEGSCFQHGPRQLVPLVEFPPQRPSFQFPRPWPEKFPGVIAKASLPSIDGLSGTVQASHCELSRCEAGKIVQELADIAIDRALHAQKLHSKIRLSISSLFSILANNFIPHSHNGCKAAHSKSSGIGDSLASSSGSGGDTVSVPSAAVTVGPTGHWEVPSKCDHNSLASTAVWKRREKIAQFAPLMSSFGTLPRRVSVVIGMAVDIRIRASVRRKFQK